MASDRRPPDRAAAAPQVRPAPQHRRRAALGRGAARLLILSVVCGLLTAAYAWFSIARSSAPSAEGMLPPVDRALAVAAPSRPARPLTATRPAEPPPPLGNPETSAGEATRESPRLASSSDPAAASTATPVDTVRAPSDDAPATTILVRHTGVDRSHGFLAVDTGEGDAGTRRATPLTCQRVHFAAGHGVCLVVERRFFTTYTAVLFDDAFRPVHRLPLNGIPSRTRLSPDGRRAAITVFVSGHSYTDSRFSTETSIVDVDTGALIVADLEAFEVIRDETPFHALDFNFWGVTFAADGNRFYASLGTGGSVYLVEGDIAARQIQVVSEGIECPALSPDETRVAFKKRLSTDSRQGWRLHVLDLETFEETALSETRSVDDQVEWLDNGRILYGLPEESGSATTHVWVVPADGSGQPEIFLEQASSPAVVRQSVSTTRTR